MINKSYGANDNTSERKGQMKKYLATAIVLLFTLGLMQSVSFADKGKGHSREKQKKESIDKKFFKKVKKIYRYQDELKVTEEQLSKIRKLKITLKKDLIRSKADMDVIGVDLRSLLYEDAIDTAKANSLIDKKYEIKKARTKNSVKSFAQLKKILSTQQLDMLQEIRRSKKKGHMYKGPPGRYGTLHEKEGPSIRYE
jgi:Spy/CpxP family protein refolding chaperone